jgi:hypothetical protein
MTAVYADLCDASSERRVRSALTGPLSEITRDRLNPPLSFRL